MWIIGFYLLVLVGLLAYAIKWRKRAELAEDAFKQLLKNYQDARRELRFGHLFNLSEIKDEKKKEDDPAN